MSFRKIDVKELEGNPFAMFDTGWALLTAGDEQKWNTMTISWGAMGWLWGKPVVFSFVRHSRYTYEFTEKGDTFTVSFFDKNDCRSQLGVLGSKSGRDMDKMHGSGLTPVVLDGAPAFEEAKCVFVCKKLHKNDFDLSQLDAANLERNYSGKNEGDNHTQYIAEIVACYVK